MVVQIPAIILAKLQNGGHHDFNRKAILITDILSVQASTDTDNRYFLISRYIGLTDNRYDIPAANVKLHFSRPRLIGGGALVWTGLRVSAIKNNSISGFEKYSGCFSSKILQALIGEPFLWDQ